MSEAVTGTRACGLAATVIHDASLPMIGGTVARGAAS